MSLPSYEQLIEQVYESVFDDAAWFDVTAALDGMLDIQGHHVALIDQTRADPHLVFSRLYLDGAPADDIEEEYLRDYFAIDERIARTPQLPLGEPIDNRQCFTGEELRTSATYNEFLRRVNGTNQVCVRLPGTGSESDVWALTRRRPRSFETSELDLLRRLGRHMGRMVHMRRALATVDALGMSLAQTIDRAAAGVFLLDRTGRIVECNDRARELLAAEGGLRDDHGLLGAKSPNAHRALRAAVRDAAAGRAPTVSAVQIPHADPGRWVVAHVGHVPRTVRALGAAVLVVVRDPWATRKMDPALVQHAFGLTAAEAEVAALLAEGRTVGEIAEQRFRTVASVRWHLKQVYAKTGLRGQADLVGALLAALGT